MRRLTLGELPIDKQIAPLLSRTEMSRLKAFVVRVEHDVVHVAAVDPLNVELSDTVVWLTRRPRVEVYPISEATYFEFVATYL